MDVCKPCKRVVLKQLDEEKKRVKKVSRETESAVIRVEMVDRLAALDSIQDIMRSIPTRSGRKK